MRAIMLLVGLCLAPCEVRAQAPPLPSELRVEVGKPADFLLDFDADVKWVALTDPDVISGTSLQPDPKSVSVSITRKREGTGYLVFGMEGKGKLIKVIVGDKPKPKPPEPKPIPPLEGSAKPGKPKIGVEEFGADLSKLPVLGPSARCKKCGDDCKCVGGCWCEAQDRIAYLLSRPAKVIDPGTGAIMQTDLRAALGAGGRITSAFIAKHNMTSAEVAAVTGIKRKPLEYVKVSPPVREVPAGDPFTIPTTPATVVVTHPQPVLVRGRYVASMPTAPTTTYAPSVGIGGSINLGGYGAGFYAGNDCQQGG